jgi:hypothetical protein
VQTSEQFDAIAAALAKAQGVMDAASKDAANPHFKAKFASLASVREAIRKPLSENGIAYIQTLRTNEGAVEVDTRLIHSSGQFIGDTLRVPLAQATPQGVGSASSYGRRYALMAIVGLAAEDDDAEAAHGRTGNGRLPISMRAKPAGPVDDDTLDRDFGPSNDDPGRYDSAARGKYIAVCKEIILGYRKDGKAREEIVKWFNDDEQKQARRDFDLTTTEVNLLKSLIAAEFPEKAKVPA